MLISQLSVRLSLPTHRSVKCGFINFATFPPPSVESEEKKNRLVISSFFAHALTTFP